MNQKIKHQCVNPSCKRRQFIYIENKIILPEPKKLAKNSNEFIFSQQNIVDYFNRIINKALLKTKDSFDIDHIHYDFMITWITNIVESINNSGTDPIVFTIFLLETMMKWSWVRQMKAYQKKTNALNIEQREFIDFIAEGLQEFAHANNLVITEEGKIK